MLGLTQSTPDLHLIQGKSFQLLWNTSFSPCKIVPVAHPSREWLSMAPGKYTTGVTGSSRLYFSWQTLQKLPKYLPMCHFKTSIGREGVVLPMLQCISSLVLLLGKLILAPSASGSHLKCLKCVKRSEILSVFPCTTQIALFWPKRLPAFFLKNLISLPFWNPGRNTRVYVAFPLAIAKNKFTDVRSAASSMKGHIKIHSLLWSW
jgi:hypothetical protein